MAGLKGSILLTGANGGLGSAIVSSIHKSAHASQYRGLYTVRNPSTASSLQSVLRDEFPSHKYELLPLDLSSLASVRALAQDINTRIANGTLEPIRAVILNAGWQETHAGVLAPQTFTNDGLEANFQVNYLSNFLLVLLILQSMDKKFGRIIMISSTMHDSYNPQGEALKMYRKEDKEMFKGIDELARGISYTDDGSKAGVRRYGASKLLMVMFMYSLQRRLSSDPILSKISVLALDPGGMAGTGMGSSGPLLIRIITGPLGIVIQEILNLFMANPPMRPTRRSAADIMFAAFDAKVFGSHLDWVYLDGNAKAESSVESRDEQKQEEAWKGSLRITNVKEGDTILTRWQ